MERFKAVARRLAAVRADEFAAVQQRAQAESVIRKRRSTK
jgi:hypothetical protein